MCLPKFIPQYAPPNYCYHSARPPTSLLNAFITSLKVRFKESILPRYLWVSNPEGAREQTVVPSAGGSAFL